ncbi:MAG: hypothetical protein RSE41_00050 [Clostridia bacterium]
METKIVNETFYIGNNKFSIGDIVTIEYKEGFSKKFKTEVSLKKGITSVILPDYIDIKVLIKQYMIDKPIHDFKKGDIVIYENKFYRYIGYKGIGKIIIISPTSENKNIDVPLSKLTKAIIYYFLSSKGIVQSDYVGRNPEREFFCKKFGIYFENKIDAYKKLDEVLK